MCSAENYMCCRLLYPKFSAPPAGPLQAAEATFPEMAWIFTHSLGFRVEPRGRGSTEAAEVRHVQTSSKPVSYTQAAEATTNHENDNEPRRTALIMKPTRESDGAPTPRTKLNGSSRSAIYTNRSSKPVSYTHRSRASSKSTAGGAKHRS